MISVIIPVLNERDAIVNTVNRAKRTLESAGIQPYEVIVVDDGSSDGTGDLARTAGAKVVTHPHNVGYGRSLKDGITAASFDVICIADADGSYPIESIPDLIEDYRRGFDMVRTVLARSCSKLGRMNALVPRIAADGNAGTMFIFDAEPDGVAIAKGQCQTSSPDAPPPSAKRNVEHNSTARDLSRYGSQRRTRYFCKRARSTKCQHS